VNIASVRILRMAVATGISMYVSQVGNWQMSFVAPIFTMFILALPLPVLKFSGGIKFALVFIGSIYATLLLLPVVIYYHLAGVLLIALALFLSFYYTARGGSAVLGTFVTVGIALVTAIGSVSIDMVLGVIGGLNIGIIVGILFVWVGHALIPDSLAIPEKSPPPAPAAPVVAEPNNLQARKSAYRSLLIVMPILIWFLLSSSSTSYVVVMIKVASMGQQASLDSTRQAAKTILKSILLGGVAAIIAWQILSIHTSLLLYALLIVLAGLIFGRRIFQGPGSHPSAAVWSDAYLTMIIILAPAVLDGQVGNTAGAAFWSRLILLIGASLYGVAAVYIFDLLAKSGPLSTADTQEA
jgi:Protein of unknown function (DUF2955)